MGCSAERHPWRAFRCGGFRQCVRGIGLSGQMHGLVLLDGSDRVIRPALIWCDQRSQAQVEAINASVGKETVLASSPILF